MDKGDKHMKLWEPRLLRYLSDAQIKEQHKDCCYLRGQNWGKNCATVNYVFKYFYGTLYYYHLDVIAEIDYRNKYNLWSKNKKLNINKNWKKITYRGDKLGHTRIAELPNFQYIKKELTFTFKEHDNTYLMENLHNLKYNTKKSKDIDLFHLFPFIKDIGYYDNHFWDNWFQSL